MDFITIIKMDEYNPRKDRKTHQWFRVDNTIPFSKKMSKLDAEQRWFFVFLVSIASFNQTDVVELDFDYLALHSAVPKKKIPATLQLLADARLISMSGNQSVTDRIPTDTDRCPTLQTNKQTNNTPQSADVVSGLFKTAAAEYPKPAGPNAEKRFAEQFSALPPPGMHHTEFANLMDAIRHYKAMLALDENAWRAPKQTFAAFLGTKSGGHFWRDYIDPSSALPTKQSKSGPKAISYKDARAVLAEAEVEAAEREAEAQREFSEREGA